MASELDALLDNAKKLRSFRFDRPEISAIFSVFDTDYGETVRNVYLYNKKENDKTYRIHAYVNADPLRPHYTLSLFKNSIPSWIKNLSSGDDTEELESKYFFNPNGSKTSMLYLIGKVFENIDGEQERIKSLQMSLITKITVKSPSNLALDREYLLPNARDDAYGQKVCWHIYPADDKTIFALEHPVYVDYYKGTWSLPPGNI